jgi:dTDP-4-dehydrorhamnose 3,5-epimerase
MQIIQGRLPGCSIIKIHQMTDARGRFTKTFNHELFQESGLATNFVEEYVTVSRSDVIRGLHFQRPPKDHTKLVCCLHGKIMDVVVDLRIGSPAYGQHEIFHLEGESGWLVYIPPGLAHGFCVLSSTAIVLYNVTSLYSESCDAGIRWDSAGISWPLTHPVLSERDQRFEALSDFKSPFVFNRAR